MCLAVPGQITEWLEREPPFSSATIDFGGVRRTISMACVPNAVEGDYVLVHAGIAISCIDPEQASRILSALSELGLDETDESTPSRDDGTLERESP